MNTDLQREPTRSVTRRTSVLQGAFGVLRSRPSLRTGSWSAKTLDVEHTVALGRWLKSEGYRFTTGTPDSHRRVLANDAREARDLRDIFGWSRAFHEAALPADALTLLRQSGGLQVLKGGLLRSRIRFSSLEDMLFVHSAYPTHAGDAVFFGPDTYRFVNLLRRAIGERRHETAQVVDIGCGSGVGGLVAAHLLGPSTRITLGDVSAAALRCAAINTAVNGFEASSIRSNVLNAVRSRADLIISNPPYLTDPEKRVYRNGGGSYGCELSLRIVRESLPKLSVNGQLVIYTGTAIVNGVDTFKTAVEPLLRDAKTRYSYEEIDPDVFGEELDQPAYAGVERIAVIGLVATNGPNHGRRAS